MTFNIALSGLAAASKDLAITGNNIANASTIGFKASRAEFADVYASSLLGSGGNQVGGHAMRCRRGFLVHETAGVGDQADIQGSGRLAAEFGPQ